MRMGEKKNENGREKEGEKNTTTLRKFFILFSLIYLAARGKTSEMCEFAMGNTGKTMFSKKLFPHN